MLLNEAFQDESIKKVDSSLSPVMAQHWSENGNSYNLADLFGANPHFQWMGPLIEVIRYLSLTDVIKLSKINRLLHEALRMPVLNGKSVLWICLESEFDNPHPKYPLWKILFKENTREVMKSYFSEIYTSALVGRVTFNERVQSIHDRFDPHKAKLTFSNDPIPLIAQAAPKFGRLNSVHLLFDDVSCENILVLIQENIAEEISCHKNIFYQHLLNDTVILPEIFNKFKEYLPVTLFRENIFRWILENNANYCDQNYVLSEKEILLVKELEACNFDAIVKSTDVSWKKEKFIALILHAVNAGAITKLRGTDILKYAEISDVFKQIILKQENLRKKLAKNDQEKQTLDLLKTSIGKSERQFSHLNQFFETQINSLKDLKFSEAKHPQEIFDNLEALSHEIQNFSADLQNMQALNGSEELKAIQTLDQKSQALYKAIFSVLKDQLIKNIWWDIKKDLLHSTWNLGMSFLGAGLLVLGIIFPMASWLAFIVGLTIFCCSFHMIGFPIPLTMFSMKLHTLLTGKGNTNEDIKLIGLATNIENFINLSEDFTFPEIKGIDPVVELTEDNNENNNLVDVINGNSYHADMDLEEVKKSEIPADINLEEVNEESAASFTKLGISDAVRTIVCGIDAEVEKTVLANQVIDNPNLDSSLGLSLHA